LFSSQNHLMTSQLTHQLPTFVSSGYIFLPQKFDWLINWRFYRSSVRTYIRRLSTYSYFEGTCYLFFWPSCISCLLSTFMCIGTGSGIGPLIVL
jgi:hypothetical protein